MAPSLSVSNRSNASCTCCFCSCVNSLLFLGPVFLHIEYDKPVVQSNCREHRKHYGNRLHGFINSTKAQLTFSYCLQARSQDCQNEEADRSSAPPLPFPTLRSHTYLPYPPIPTPPLLSPPLPLEVGPLKSSYGVWGSAVSFPSGVWGGAPA